MPIVNKTILKAYFQTGQPPTEDQFENLIDSFLRVEVGFGTAVDAHFLRLDLAPGGILQDALGRPILLSEGESISSVLDPGEAYLTTLDVGSGSGMPGSSGFLGLSFDLTDNGQATTHFGFLEVGVDGAGSATPYAIELVGFAYETEAGVPITTFAVPEPGTALLLTLGLTIGALFRRRRKAPRSTLE